MDVYGRIDVRGKFWVQRAIRITDLQWTEEAISRLVYAKQTDGLWFGGNSAWRQLTHARDLMNDGQKMIFMTYPLPNNWTVDATDHDDRSVTIDNNNTRVGDRGGSWFITGMNNQNVRHNHYAPTGMGGPTTSRAVGASEIYSRSSNLSHQHYMSNDELHSHSFDGTWRPEYINGIVGVYNP